MKKGNMMNRGRCRFYAALLLLMSCAAGLAFFYSVQQELLQERNSFLKCEQQQQSLNNQLQSEIEQKFRMQQNQEHEVNEYLETKMKYERKLKDQTDSHNQELSNARSEYEKLQQAYETLQTEHQTLETEYATATKQRNDAVKALEKQVQSLQSELNTTKGVHEAQMQVWKDNFERVSKEKKSLEWLLKGDGVTGDHFKQIMTLEAVIKEYRENCNFNPNALPDHLQEAKSSTHRQKKFNEKSFNQQIIVSPGVYQIPVKEHKTEQAIVPNQLKKSESAADQRASGSAVSPLMAPRKQTSTESSKILEANAHLQQIVSNKSSAIGSSTSRNLPPLPVPENAKTNQRKLPENVAPIPAFDAFLKDEALDNDIDVVRRKQKKDTNNGGEVEAAESLVNEKNAVNNNESNNNNNRYANVVNDLAAEVSKQKSLKKSAKILGNQLNNLDSGAHEVKDNEVGNDNNMKMGGHDDNNFFEMPLNQNKENAFAAGLDAPQAKQSNRRDEFDDNPDDDMLDGIGANNDEDNGLGGPLKNEVKHQVQGQHHMLEDDDNENNLNNEVVGDQGKEFPGDGIHLEEINEEDEDEDDYANLAARQQGAQAIRN